MYNIIKTTGEVQATVAPRKFDKPHDHEEVRRIEETEVDSCERERSKRAICSVTVNDDVVLRLLLRHQSARHQKLLDLVPLIPRELEDLAKVGRLIGPGRVLV